MLVDIDPLLKKCKEIYNRRTPFAASLMIMEMEKAARKEGENEKENSEGIDLLQKHVE